MNYEEHNYQQHNLRGDGLWRDRALVHLRARDGYSGKLHSQPSESAVAAGTDIPRANRVFCHLVLDEQFIAGLFTHA